MSSSFVSNAPSPPPPAPPEGCEVSATDREAMIRAEVYLSTPHPPDPPLTDPVLLRWFGTPEQNAAAIRAAAVASVDEWLSLPVVEWTPGQWKPSRPRFVDYPVRWRARGGCEDCRRSRDCHTARHATGNGTWRLDPAGSAAP